MATSKLEGTAGKRRPSAPLVTTSDEEDHLDSADTSRNSVSTDTSSASTDTNTNSSVEYENVASPCSSTSSGPVYVRPPGFTHHAQEVVCRSKIKKKKTYTTLKEGLKRREPTPPKHKPKRESVPMRLRALPQSFWQQPNRVHNAPPGNCFSVLPPLSSKEPHEELMSIRPVTPPQEKDSLKDSKEPEVKRPPVGRQTEKWLTVSKHGEEMMIKLFSHVNQEEQKKQSGQTQFRRGRPRKMLTTSKKGFLNGDDPYLVDAVTQKLFPQLSLESGIKQPSSYTSTGGNTSLQLVTVRDGDKSITLPSLCIEQNYSQMLTELVSHI